MFKEEILKLKSWKGVKKKIPEILIDHCSSATSETNAEFNGTGHKC